MIGRYGVALILVTGLAGGPAAAQYTGPSQAEQARGVQTPQTAGPASSSAGVTAVAEILRKPRDDQKVTVRGYLIRHLGGENYLFKDDTGEIVVEIDVDDFPRAQPIDDTVLVELQGEVDAHRRRAPEIDVKRVRIVTP